VDVPEIDVDELATLRTGGIALFDVREPDEFEDARVPGAVLVPLATVPDRVDEFPTSGPVYLICASGGRSKRASAFLRQHGVDAINVAGGTKAWVAAGFPHDDGPEAG
jgi:rhodanese-related sulfurtransferase